MVKKMFSGNYFQGFKQREEFCLKISQNEGQRNPVSPTAAFIVFTVNHFYLYTGISPAAADKLLTV
jgi:hypothetical protein